MYQLILVRHGQSIWNKEHLFTGWTDVDLTPEGILDARKMGRLLCKNNISFNIGYTSVLRRASLTLELIIEEMNLTNVTVVRDWRLNERHYGKLQGKSKIDILDELDWAQVHSYRRSYYTQPALLENDDPRNPAHDPKYAHIDPQLLPLGESLADAYDRIIPYMESNILPDLRKHQSLIMSLHGNTLRVVLKYLDQLSETEIEGVEFAIGDILVYSLGENLEVLNKRYISEQGDGIIE